MNLKYLDVYLNDHLAGATVGHELAKRAASSNAGTEYGAALSELEHEIAEDRAALVRLMERFDIKQDRVKTTGAYIGEKLGRLKPNAHLMSYSPLSRVVELEFLMLGVTGKFALWNALLEIEPEEDRLNRHELTVLAARAGDQRDELERMRRKAFTETMLAPAGAAS
jgi:hypothetical protein